MLFIEIWPSEGRQSRATNRSQIREPGSCEHLILARTQFSQVFTRFEEDSPSMLYTVTCAVWPATVQRGRTRTEIKYPILLTVGQGGCLIDP